MWNVGALEHVSVFPYDYQDTINVHDALLDVKGVERTRCEE
jgi:hypothetical protein